MLAVCIDDLIITKDNIRLIEQVKKELNQRYKMQDSGEMEFVLGLEVAQNTSKRTIN